MHLTTSYKIILYNTGEFWVARHTICLKKKKHF